MADDEPKLGLPVPVASAHVPEPEGPNPIAWPIRPAPTLAPFVQAGLFERRRTRRLARNLDLSTSAADAAARYFQAVESAEAAQQSAEMQHERRRTLPVIAETERAGLLTTLARGQIELDGALHEREHRQLGFEYQREQGRQLLKLEPLRWQKLQIDQRTENAESQADLDAIRRAEELRDAEAAARLAALRRSEEDARVGDERRREIETEHHRIEILRHDLAELSLVAEIRQRLVAMRQTEAARADPTPKAFAEHIKTAEEVRQTRSEAQRRIEEIYLRAAAERRPLTDTEVEQVDAIADAESAAQAEVRRGGASDL